jgi:hypothetical protein
MHAGKLEQALTELDEATREVARLLALIRAERDPFVSYLFYARRSYRNTEPDKWGKRRERAASMSYREAPGLGFRGDLRAWEELLQAEPKC